MEVKARNLDESGENDRNTSDSSNFVTPPIGDKFVDEPVD
jgi:hypothetical protein